MFDLVRACIVANELYLLEVFNALFVAKSKTSVSFFNGAKYPIMRQQA